MLDADLRHHYRLDLADLWRGDPDERWSPQLTPRRVLWLIEHLPENSATVAALRGGPEHRSWTTREHLLATIADAVQLGTWATVAANAKRRPPAPKPVPRPDSRPARAARVVTVAEIAARQQRGT